MVVRNSIRSQILWLVAGALFVSISVVVSYVGYKSYHHERENRVREAKAIADTLAENSLVAVSFGDPDSATTLLASLSSQPSVKAAVIIDTDGVSFAKYGSIENVAGDSNSGDEVFNIEWENSFENFDETASMPDAQPISLADYQTAVESWLGSERSSFHFDESLLIVSVPLIEMDESLGILVTFTDVSEITEKFWAFTRNILILLVIVTAIVLLVSKRILDSIVGPVIHLTKVAKEVSRTEDYSLRSNEQSSSEIGILCNQFNDMLQKIELAHRSLRETKEDLYVANETLELRVEERTEELEKTNARLQSEFKKKEQAYAELNDVQGQLVESSRAAGMAEIANGVLHNIGNVLNSVNVAASVAVERINGLQIGTLKRAADLLTSKQESMGDRWVEFDGLKSLPAMLSQLEKALTNGQETATQELKEVTQHIQFIEEIVRSQQSYARRPGVQESINVHDLFDNSLKLVNTSRNTIVMNVEKQYEVEGEVELDKHKALQILSNFIKNGFEAMMKLPEGSATLTLRLTMVDGNFRFSVIDVGHGIPKETLTKLFTYGFSTKPTGHGFGLHSAACAAKEMGGSIEVESDGVGKGACFSFVFPVDAETARANKEKSHEAEDSSTAPGDLKDAPQETSAFDPSHLTEFGDLNLDGQVVSASDG